MYLFLLFFSSFQVLSAPAAAQARVRRRDTAPASRRCGSRRTGRRPSRRWTTAGAWPRRTSTSCSRTSWGLTTQNSVERNIISVCILHFYHERVSASQIWDLAEGKTNTMELAEAIDSSDLEAFGFTDDFIFELWGAITDAKSGRGKTINNNNF